MIKRVDKKGLSSVVTVTLLILGTVVGVAFLWAFASKNTNKVGAVDDEGCLSVNLELVSCYSYGACSYSTGGPYYDADIVIKRNVGEGNVTGIRFIFEDSTGRKKAYDKDLGSYAFNELDTLKIVEPGVALPGENQLLRVAALVGKKKEACPITSNRVRCIQQTNVLSRGLHANNTFGFYDKPATSYRGGNCCQWVDSLNGGNTSECYIGGDSSLFASDGTLTGNLPLGNLSVCCTDKPYG